jgi:hypothetical protein
MNYDLIMIDKWISKIEQTTADFNSHFSGLCAAQLNWKPNPQVWSIAQNIDHLIVINSTYFPLIASIRAGSYRLPWIAKVPFLVRFIGQEILKSVQPDRKKRMKTFPIWEPSSSNLGRDILEKFDRHQSDLKELIIQSGDLLENNTVISSPANRYIVYSLATAFDIITAHEQRHLVQAKEVLERMLKEA